LKVNTENYPIKREFIESSFEWFGYHGGTFNDNEVHKALEEDIPLTLDIAIPGSCLNNCIYCGYYAVNSTGKLLQNEIIEIFREFKSIGGRSVKILGEGEPLLRRDIFELLEDIKKLGMIPVLFTCGDVIGSDELAQKIHGISGKDVASKMRSLGCTVVLKFEAYNKKQDRIVRRKGYSQMRDRALRLLIESGLNRFSPTRLGFGIVLLKNNFEDIRRIYHFGLEKHIYSLICPIMPIGKMENKRERNKLVPSKEHVRMLHRELCGVRENHDIDITKISDFPGGYPCDISRSGFYIDDAGNVLLCEADDFVGNIRKNRLQDLWKNISEIKWRKYGQKRRLGLCFPKRRAGII